MKNIAISTGPNHVVVINLHARLLEELRELIPTVENRNIDRFYARYEYTLLWSVEARPHKLRQIFEGVQPFQSVVEVLDMEKFHENLKAALPDSEKPVGGFHPDGHVSVSPRSTLTIYKPEWSGSKVLMSDGFCPVRMEDKGVYIKGVPADEFLQMIRDYTPEPQSNGL